MKGRVECEKATVRRMIELFCRDKHDDARTLKDAGMREGERGKESRVTLCADCRDLLDYAEHRLDGCRHGNTKPVCNKCLTHCYRPEYRARIREVMRHSGPRLILHRPLEAVEHLLREIF